ncbi:MAG: ATP-binding protein, partial [Bacteroidales bacterium]|nr:ATP-binding protein [Bacteroidales bacterium]
EAGMMKVKIGESNLNNQMENVYNMLKPEAEAKHLKLSFVNAFPLDRAYIKSDKEKVYSIITNLVKNAIKYTDQGEVEFSYKLVDGKSDAPPELLFCVKDTGVGIPKERQKAIFERFIQADIADLNGREGAGLGLSITKAYVEMLGGKIGVESEVGKGSLFYFTIPYNAEPGGVSEKQTNNKQQS